MYPGLQAQVRPNQPAIVMAQSGEVITYAELDRRSTRLAHVLRAHGLARLDHYAIFMENNARYIECCAAGERAGLLYTCVNSYLTPDELAYILNNCEARVLITSQARREVALARVERMPADHALRCRGRSGRRRRCRQSQRGDKRLSRYTDRR